MQRRTILRLSASSLALAALTPWRAQAQIRALRMIEAGGPSGDSIEAAYIQPFSAKTGVKVIRESPTSVGKLQAMVRSRNITAALVELPGETDLAFARFMNLLEPLDWDAIDPAPIFDQARQPDAFGWQYFSTIMAWVQEAKPLHTWANFWNVKDFPGVRALPDYPAYALPAALLADGVARDAVYPMDVDRAFASLERIKPHISVWWQSGAQPAQLLQDREISYAMAWSGRVVGQPNIQHTYQQGLLDLSYFVVPKGIEPARKALAMKLLHEMSLLQNQIRALDIVPYPGSSTQIDTALPQEKLALYPTSPNNVKQQVPMQQTWTPEEVQQVERRWQNFKLSL